MTGCPFCWPYHGPSRVLWQDGEPPSVYAVRPVDPVTPGHALFVPGRHVTQADHPTVAAAFRAAAHYGMFYRREYEHFNLILSVGERATQTVEHAHVHLVPRRDGDGLALPWTGQKREPEPELPEMGHPETRGTWGRW